MVTKQDVACSAGVSTATVGRVISGKGYVSNQARTAVQRAIVELRYHPNRLASNLRKQRSNVIAVLVEDLLNPYYMHLVDAMVERANDSEYVVSLFAIKKRDVHMVLDDLLANRVCGIVNLAMFTCDFSCYDIFIEAGVKLINCTDADAKVQVNYATGMMQALEYLKSKGSKDVAFIAGLEPWLTKKDQRVQCYERNLERLGFTQDERLLLSDDYPREKAHNVGYRLCCELIDSGVKFDTVICLTDMMALGAMKALFDRKYNIPNDVSVVGCDNLEFGQYFQPSLTTIDVDKKAEGTAYVDYILNADEHAGLIEIPTRLVVRDSVRR